MCERKNENAVDESKFARKIPICSLWNELKSKEKPRHFYYLIVGTEPVSCMSTLYKACLDHHFQNIYFGRLNKETALEIELNLCKGDLIHLFYCGHKSDFCVSRLPMDHDLTFRDYENLVSKILLSKNVRLVDCAEGKIDIKV